MHHSSIGTVSASHQSEKRAWNEPSISDEDARNTAQKGPDPTEQPTTDGPGS